MGIVGDSPVSIASVATAVGLLVEKLASKADTDATSNALTGGLASGFAVCACGLQLYNTCMF